MRSPYANETGRIPIGIEKLELIIIAIKGIRLPVDFKGRAGFQRPEKVTDRVKLKQKNGHSKFTLSGLGPCPVPAFEQGVSYCSN